MNYSHRRGLFLNTLSKYVLTNVNDDTATDVHWQHTDCTVLSWLYSNLLRLG